jgi:hypothetical protein
VISTCPALGLRAWLVVWGDVLVTLLTGTAAADRQFKGARVDTLSPRTKNLSAPDETLSLEKGSASTVRIRELVVGRLVLEPGWRWSRHVGPIAGTAGSARTAR